MSLQLGKKTYGSSTVVGGKSYKNANALGNKYSIISLAKGNSQIHATTDGIINNDSNTKHMQTEPMGMNKYTEKSHIRNITHSSIEKQRRKKPDKNERNYD